MRLGKRDLFFNNPVFLLNEQTIIGDVALQSVEAALYTFPDTSELLEKRSRQIVIFIVEQCFKFVQLSQHRSVIFQTRQNPLLVLFDIGMVDCHLPVFGIFLHKIINQKQFKSNQNLVSLFSFVRERIRSTNVTSFFFIGWLKLLRFGFSCPKAFFWMTFWT